MLILNTIFSLDFKSQLHVIFFTHSPFNLSFYYCVYYYYYYYYYFSSFSFFLFSLLSLPHLPSPTPIPPTSGRHAPLTFLISFFIYLSSSYPLSSLPIWPLLRAWQLDDLTQTSILFFFFFFSFSPHSTSHDWPTPHFFPFPYFLL